MPTQGAAKTKPSSARRVRSRSSSSIVWFLPCSIIGAAHRPALYAEKLGVTQDTIVTPELAARLINLEGFHTRVLVNQAQTQRELALARELAAYLHCPVAAGELLKEKMICLC